MIKLEIYRQSNPHMPNIQGVLIHAKNEEGVEIKKKSYTSFHSRPQLKTILCLRKYL